MSQWIRELSPADREYGDGWCRQLDRCFRKERKYVVMTRQIETEWGLVTHATIRNRDNTDIPWMEKQKIKNELFGRESVAIEVFPVESRLINQANSYHLWVLPEAFSLPFGIHEKDNPGKYIPRPLMIKTRNEKAEEKFYGRKEN